MIYGCYLYECYLPWSFSDISERNDLPQRGKTVRGRHLSIAERLMRTSARLALIFISLTCCGVAQAKHPITFEDLMKVRRVSDPQVSPDGHCVAFALTQVDLD